MIILHAVQKLLNTSGLKPVMYVSAPSEGQQMHSWYVKLVSSTFTGKLLTMYVHEPSLMTVLTRGKTIKTTLPQFMERLPLLLQRHNFKPEFIAREMQLVREGYVVSKTNNRSMVSFMNQMTLQIEVKCLGYSSYELIDLDGEEDLFMEWLSFDKASRKYRFTKEYWAERDVLLS